MIVTIDGPAGAGKSSVARTVAEQLGFEFLDTGALYRAATLACQRAGIDMQDPDAIIRLVENTEIRWHQHRVSVDGVDVTDSIRAPAVADQIGLVADIPRVRRSMTELQRAVARDRDIVTEGRDQGSEVFPNAECKIFLDASAEERARRRQHQLESSGRPTSYTEVLAAQQERDIQDRRRPVGALRKAEDARVIDSDRMSPQQVVDEIIRLVEKRMDAKESG